MVVMRRQSSTDMIFTFCVSASDVSAGGNSSKSVVNQLASSFTPFSYFATYVQKWCKAITERDFLSRFNLFLSVLTLEEMLLFLCANVSSVDIFMGRDIPVANWQEFGRPLDYQARGKADDSLMLQDPYQEIELAYNVDICWKETPNDVVFVAREIQYLWPRCVSSFRGQPRARPLNATN